MKIKLALTLCLIAVAFPLFAQSPSKLVEDYFKAVNAKQSTSEIIQKLQSEESSSIFYEIIPYTLDSLSEIRYEAYYLLDILGKRTNKENVKSKILKTMIKGCRDKESGICGMLLDKISGFRQGDFDTEAKYELSLLVKEKIPYLDKLIRITGFVGIEDLKFEYVKILNEKTYPNNKIRWVLNLALSRMGDQAATDFCVRKVRSLSVNDDVVYDVLPDLVYTRQKAAFDYLLEIIESDEKNCSSPNPDSNAKILCAYRVIEQIAPFIENFPLSVDASGDINVTDYGVALTNVRVWIKTNKENYTIRNDIY